MALGQNQRDNRVDQGFVNPRVATAELGAHRQQRKVVTEMTAGSKLLLAIPAKKALGLGAVRVYGGSGYEAQKPRFGALLKATKETFGRA